MNDQEKPPLSAFEEKLNSLLDPRKTLLFRRKAPGLYGSLNDRMFAAALDLFWMVILLQPMIQRIHPWIYDEERNLDALAQAQTVGQFPQAAVETGELTRMLTESVVAFLVTAPLIGFMWTYGSVTPGKWLLRMRIVDAQTFAKPTNRQFFLRLVGYLASMLPLFLGIFWIGLDKRKRGWHDHIAGTCVVRVKHWRIRDDGTEPHIVLPPEATANTPETASDAPPGTSGDAR